MSNYYEILEIVQNASQDEIRQAYRRLALRWHPDKNPDNVDEATRRFKEISEAYEILSDQQQREDYDRDLQRDLLRGHSSSSGIPHGFQRRRSNLNFRFRTPDEIFASFFADFNESFTSGFTGFPFDNNDDFFQSFFGSTTGRGINTFTTPSTSGSTRSGPSFASTSFFQSSGTSSGPTVFSSSAFHSSTSSQTRGGTSTTTRTVVANGIETTQVWENGQLISETSRQIEENNAPEVLMNNGIRAFFNVGARAHRRLKAKPKRRLQDH